MEHFNEGSGKVTVSCFKGPSDASIGTCYCDLVSIVNVEGSWVPLTANGQADGTLRPRTGMFAKKKSATHQHLSGYPLSNRCCSYQAATGTVRFLLRQLLCKTYLFPTFSCKLLWCRTGWLHTDKRANKYISGLCKQGAPGDITFISSHVFAAQNTLAYHTKLYVIKIKLALESKAKHLWENSPWWERGKVHSPNEYLRVDFSKRLYIKSCT